LNLALFDLDGTLLEIDSDHAFGEFMVRVGWADAEAFRQANDHFYAQYKAECLDVDAYIAACRNSPPPANASRAR
jgi:phosphoserine phosphatase